jgi:hypothetical protein
MRFTPMKLAAATLTLAAGMLCMPGALLAQAGAGTIRGRVIEAGSGRPVPDV